MVYPLTLRFSDHPRIRGEHAEPILPSSDLNGSSPHTRGAPSDRGYLICGVRIIPAYAGSTRSRPSW